MAATRSDAAPATSTRARPRRRGGVAPGEVQPLGTAGLPGGVRHTCPLNAGAALGASGREKTNP